ncbi:MAG: chemotaxis protein CheA [Deltaproteobacteria bacterium]|nr:chemotaxis protein CheA [Deltaproteobacteria bacterium]MCL4874870.1 chemotaxis protein CheA [bacterium]
MEIDLGQAKTTFLAESQELLEEMESSLLILERDPADQNAVNSLFRAAHTIKGSSGVLGIETVEKFTHFVENLLEKMRTGQIKADSGNIELLLQCRDHISRLITLAADEVEGLSGDLLRADNDLSAKLAGCLDERDAAPAVQAEAPEALEGPSSRTDAWHISIRFGRNTLKTGMDPISFIAYLAKLGEVVSITTLFFSMPGPEEMDPEDCYLGFEIDLKSDFDKKAIEDVFDFVRDESTIRILPPYSRMASYVELIKGMPEDSLLLGEILVKGGALTAGELEEALKYQDESQAAKRPLIGEILVEEGSTYPEIINAALEKQKKNQSISAKEAATLRIDAAKLDSLMNLVGELVIAGAGIDQHAARIGDTPLQESASIMLRLVEEIRESAMKVRMVPIGETFNRFRRVVRDISRELGKEIEISISGAETELDKNVIEKISDPLMHLVRNAADHGIETTEARKAAGKRASGTIRLRAGHDAGCIVIEVEDDGRGLDREKIVEKAVARGLVAAGQHLTDAEAFKLVFEPGFSTADEVTKFSGRGVGMDVVRKNIEALRGTIEMESARGKGTTVRVRLPLTMAIIDGFMVGIGQSPYIIPLDMVVECVELSEEDRRAAGKRNYVNLRGEVLPFIRLKEFFNETGEDSKYENIVIVQYAGHKIGLVVDELFGEVQTVIKSLGRVYREVKGISGATILGNGRVALILDVPRLMQTIEKNYFARAG